MGLILAISAHYFRCHTTLVPQGQLRGVMGEESWGMRSEDDSTAWALLQLEAF